MSTCFVGFDDCRIIFIFYFYKNSESLSNIFVVSWDGASLCVCCIPRLLSHPQRLAEVVVLKVFSLIPTVCFFVSWRYSYVFCLTASVSFVCLLYSKDFFRVPIVCIGVFAVFQGVLSYPKGFVCVGLIPRVFCRFMGSNQPGPIKK